MDHYAGPATVLSATAQVGVIVDLNLTTGVDRRVGWAGRVKGERDALSRAVSEMREYGLVVRLDDGREGHFVPEEPITWSSGGINVRGFFRGERLPSA